MKLPLRDKKVQFSDDRRVVSTEAFGRTISISDGSLLLENLCLCPDASCCRKCLTGNGKRDEGITRTR